MFQVLVNVTLLLITSMLPGKMEDESLLGKLEVIIDARVIPTR
jgi:hypothetical protein